MTPRHLLITSLALAATSLTAEATVRFSRLFSDHMVLQRDKSLPVWGWAEPGETVSVLLAGQAQTTQAGADGAFRVTFKALPTTTTPLTLEASAQSGKATVSDILVGEVWLCSGQSNMQWVVKDSWNGDLETLAAGRCEKLRLLTVRTPGTQKAVPEPDDVWKRCTAESLPVFSAVGYYFGRQIYDTLGEDVPVGLIDNSWGGSSCESWIRRDAMDGKDVYDALLDRWEKTEREFTDEVLAKREQEYREKLAAYKSLYEEWSKKAADAASKGEAVPPAPPTPRRADNPMAGNQRPGNLYYGRLKPVMGYAIRGAIWYQGETNAGRAYQYRDMFPLMIETWRKDWGIGDFPFYWVQLADFQAEVPTPGDSDWAELREAQTMALRLPNTGQAVIVDIGEGNDIHPREKLEVGRRLARWALAKVYNQTVDCQSPTMKKAEKGPSGSMTVSFDHTGGGLRTIDVNEVKGFAIAGADKKWYPATAQIQGPDKVMVKCAEVPDPVAVRYAWASNPVCNLAAKNGLPVTPFRSDDWPGLTAEKR